MSKRFGRNQRRRLLAQIQDAELAHGAVDAMRRWAREGLGFNCTFVDDDMVVVVGLAQRAVLAGLDTDFKPDMQKRFREASEQWRQRHEAVLGRTIAHQ